MKPRAPEPVSRRLFLVLLGAAVFLRAFVPQGYMPERDGQGAIAVAICGSDDLWLVPIGNSDGEQQEDDHRNAQPCAFAGLSDPLTPAPGPGELPLSVGTAPILPDGRYTAWFLAPPRSLPPARGPPLPA